MKTDVEVSGLKAEDRRQVFICACKSPNHAFELWSEDDCPWVCLGLNWPDCCAHFKVFLKTLWYLLRGNYKFGDFLLPNEDIDAFCEFLQESKKRFTRRLKEKAEGKDEKQI